MSPTQNKGLENQEKKFYSTDFKQIFLIEFTKQLILNSAPMEVLRLKEMISEEEKRKQFKEEKKEEDHEEHVKNVLEISDEEYEKSFLPHIEREYQESQKPTWEKHWAKPVIKKKTYSFEPFKDQRLTMPESNFPNYLNHLRPTPTQQEIDLGKINPLLKDPFVKSIECQGADSNVLVRGKMGEKKTAIVLNEDEINEIIDAVSKASKIPKEEGVYKVAVGKLVFTAIISEEVGSRFLINKMTPSIQRFK